MHILTEISTKGRYDTTLPLAIMSVIQQTRKPDEFLLIDDNDKPIDLRDKPIYNYLFRTMDEVGIKWKVLWGNKRGQHYNHEMTQEQATELIWRLDDDEIAEPDCLEELSKEMKEGVGSVAGLVLAPPFNKVSTPPSTKIKDIDGVNAQWVKWGGKPIEAEHLYSSFLYRKGIAHYELSLSKVAHREESLLSHEIFRKGYKLIINPKAVTWHYRNPEGGIRQGTVASMWEHDEKIFQEKLKDWGVNCEPVKIVYLNNGLGDHIMFKSILPELKKKYKKIVIYCCYPDVFEGEDTRSIAEGNQTLSDTTRFDVYKYCWDFNWKTKMADAFRAMYL